MILGDPGSNVPPTDALMFESPFDRTTLQGLNQTHPIPALGTSGACERTAPRPSDQRQRVRSAGPGRPAVRLHLPAAPRRGSAERRPDATAARVSSGSGQAALQRAPSRRFAKAYPGLRHLQVLKGIGEQVPGVNNAIVASICPKITDRNNPAYGYNPAIAAIIERLKEQLTAVDR